MPHSFRIPIAKKLLAGGWFAGFALLACAVFFFHPPLAFKAVFLYILLPSLCGGVAGFFGGGAILDSSRVKTYAKSLLRGLGVTVGAYVIFAAVFAFTLTLTERGWSARQAPALFADTLLFGFLMVGPFMLFAGMIAAVTLHGLGRHALKKNVVVGN